MKVKRKDFDFFLLIVDSGEVKNVRTGSELNNFVVFGATGFFVTTKP